MPLWALGGMAEPTHGLRYHVASFSVALLGPKGLTVGFALSSYKDGLYATEGACTHNCIVCLFTPSFVREGLSPYRSNLDYSRATILQYR